MTNNETIVRHRQDDDTPGGVIVFVLVSAFMFLGLLLVLVCLMRRIRANHDDIWPNQLSTQERKEILEHVLEGKPYSPESSSDEDESGSSSTQESSSLDNVAGGDERDVNAEQDQETNVDSTCAICLCEYEKDQLVVTGTSCLHLFHKECAFEWLAKDDHCPYCRELMVTDAEMRAAALEIWGRERVQELWGQERG